MNTDSKENSSVKFFIIKINTGIQYPPHVFPNAEGIYYKEIKFGQLQFTEKHSEAKVYDNLMDCITEYNEVNRRVNEYLAPLDSSERTLPYKPVHVLETIRTIK